MTEQHTAPGPDPKVLRLIRTYNLEGVGDELEAQWTHSENRTSLRALAESFNERLLRTVLADADVDPLTDDVGRLYALLEGEEGTRGEQTAARRRLERAGIDVETLRSEFVSYGAIRSYLTGYRDASLPDTDENTRETESRTIEGLRQRTVAVTESKLARLRDAGHLQLGSHRVLADVQVLCEECGRQYDVATLLETGACDCRDP
ncbi:rod-determining factor RdfA [Natrinema sp. SYSU A 869]|uniref:rod-determining factor RdfA n=1 Tax=Natrinema sp. SYSU A 869 TaxID=2871694 RepID=UPI001CA42E55|nr:rod-determining factor RdfA [Natrinema sp. SYSU A 869]